MCWSKSAARSRPLKAADLPLGGPQILAWPMDPANKTVRDGTRLNKVLLLRLDPAGFDATTRERAADGVVAYSAICPHAGCDVTQWLAETQRLECPCHFSQYDPKAGAAVVGGPSPRPLPALPLKTVDGRLVVAKPFTGRVGFQQSEVDPKSEGENASATEIVVGSSHSPPAGSRCCWPGPRCAKAAAAIAATRNPGAGPADPAELQAGDRASS